jgi:uncharacterized membrane protein YdbT with pleckstrin-like domain
MRSFAAFVDIRPDEDVVWHARQHWSQPVRRAVVPVLLLLVSLVAALASGQTRAAWPAPWSFVASAGLMAWSALCLARLVWVYLDWIDDALIVTTQRIVWLRKTAFFHETRRELPLHRVQNVTMAVRGLLPTWLGYGDLLVEAAGGSPLEVPAIGQPDRLRQRIFELQAQHHAERQHRQRTATDAAMRAALGWTPPATTQARSSAPVIRLPGALAVTPPDPPSVADGPITWRRHWWFLTAAAVRPVLLITVTIVAATQAPRLPGLRGELAFLLALALLALALIGLASLIWEVLAWREDAYVLDGDRLLDIEGRPFRLYREVKQTSLARVQDVSYRIPSPLAHLLDYGDVLIETAGETQHFTFNGVANPRAVYAEISRRLAATRQAEAETRHQQVRDQVFTLLRTYHRLAEGRDETPDA